MTQPPSYSASTAYPPPAGFSVPGMYPPGSQQEGGMYPPQGGGMYPESQTGRAGGRKIENFPFWNPYA